MYGVVVSLETFQEQFKFASIDFDNFGHTMKQVDRSKYVWPIIAHHACIEAFIKSLNFALEELTPKQTGALKLGSMLSKPLKKNIKWPNNIRNRC